MISITEVLTQNKAYQNALNIKSAIAENILIYATPWILEQQMFSNAGQHVLASTDSRNLRLEFPCKYSYTFWHKMLLSLTSGDSCNRQSPLHLPSPLIKETFCYYSKNNSLPPLLWLELQSMPRRTTVFKMPFSGLLSHMVNQSFG